MASVATSGLLQLVNILNLLLALQFACNRVVNGHLGTLKIPSLGRVSKIGNLYDERRDEFTEHYIFASGQPILSHVTSEASTNKIQTSAVIQNFSDKFKFFELDLDTCVNIITGLVQPTGSGEILRTKRNGSVSGGIFMTTIDTVKENLQIFSPTFRQFMSPGSTDIMEATHVVSGIRWGGRLAIEFTSNGDSDLKDQANLNSYFEKLRRAQHNASEIGDGDRSFKMVAHSDLTLSSASLNNFSQAYDLLHSMPSSLQQLSSGKGVPLEYTLTPLSILREYLGEPTRTRTSLISYPAPDMFLRDVINIFDDIYRVRNDVHNLIVELSYAHPSNCINPAAVNELRSLETSFENAVTELTSDLNSALVRVRSGEVRGSSSLFHVLTSYKESDYSHANVPHLLAEFEPEQERVRFCIKIRSFYSDVMYIGRGEKVVPVSNQTMYVLYKKKALIEEGRGIWQENLHTFLEVLNKPYSTRLVVDCDLAAAEECKDLNWTTIRQIRNVTVTMGNVGEELKTETCLPDGQSVLNLCKLNECQNGASCSPSLYLTDFVCTCLSGFIGRTCDKKVEECWTGGKCCSNRGTCEPTDENNTFYGCICSPGYEGQHCETDRDDCTADACSNNGTCLDGVDSFSCECAPGFTGRTCEGNVDDCGEPSPCLNGGTCHDKINSYTCVCVPGYDGTECERDRDDCAGRSLCLNGGSCVDAVNNYTCICRPGFAGSNCERNVDDCSGHRPCWNGGSCMDGENTYRCACARGYKGLNCEVNIDDCEGGLRCRNGGTCVDGVETYTCFCLAGYTGRNCATNVDDCVENPCINGGTCKDGLQTYTCLCPAGYTGQNCATNVDDCVGNPCRNGGTCVDRVQTYSCVCAAGYTGRNCATDVDDCVQNPCRNGGTCVDQTNGYQCNCLPKFHGTMCEYNSCTRDQGTVTHGTTTSTSCGGVVNFPDFPAYPSSFYFEYKSVDRFSDKRKCVWTFNSMNDHITYKLYAQVTLLCLGNSNLGAAISVLHLGWSDDDDEYVLYTHPLSALGNMYKTKTSWWGDYKLFLSYTSSGTPGHGFKVKVELLSRASHLYGTDLNYALGSPFSGSLEWTKMYREHSTFVLNPQTSSTKLTIRFETKKTNSQCEYWDTLMVYEIQTTAQLRVRMCITHFSYSIAASNNPIVAIIRTSRHVEVKKIEFTWG